VYSCYNLKVFKTKKEPCIKINTRELNVVLVQTGLLYILRTVVYTHINLLYSKVYMLTMRAYN